MDKVNANDKIIKTYWSLAKDNKLTVSNLCKKAKINRSTFYQYYLDIYELADKEENRIINEIITKVNKEFPETIPNDISEFTRVIIDIFGNYDEYLFILLTNNSSNFEKKLTKEISKRIPKVLNIQENNNYFKYIITYLISNVCTLLKCWYENEKDLSFEEIALLIHKLVFNGLIGFKEKSI